MLFLCNKRGNGKIPTRSKYGYRKKKGLPKYRLSGSGNKNTKRSGFNPRTRRRSSIMSAGGSSCCCRSSSGSSGSGSVKSSMVIAVTLLIVEAVVVLKK